MITIIQFDDKKNPVGTMQFAFAEDAPAETPGTVRFEGELAVPFEEIQHRWRVRSGEFVDTGGPPSKWHDWNPETEQWVPNLQRARSETWTAIKLQRSAAEFGGFAFNGMLIDSDPISQSRIQGAVLEAMLAVQTGGAFSKNWTLANNEVVTLSGSEVLAVGLAMSLHVSGAHERGRLLRAKIDQADLEALSAISWNDA